MIFTSSARMPVHQPRTDCEAIGTSQLWPLPAALVHGRAPRVDRRARPRNRAYCERGFACHGPGRFHQPAHPSSGLVGANHAPLQPAGLAVGHSRYPVAGAAVAGRFAAARAAGFVAGARIRRRPAHRRIDRRPTGIGFGARQDRAGESRLAAARMGQPGTLLVAHASGDDRAHPTLAGIG